MLAIQVSCFSVQFIDRRPSVSRKEHDAPLSAMFIVRVYVYSVVIRP